MARRRGLSPADLTPEQLAAAGLERRRRGGPSRLEDRYRAYLDARAAAGEVLGYVEQPDPIELAHRCTYQPDFLVTLARGHDSALEYVEVKGRKGNRPWFHDDGARVKVRVAARQLAAIGIRLVVVWPKRGGGWCREVVPV